MIKIPKQATSWRRSFRVMTQLVLTGILTAFAATYSSAQVVNENCPKLTIVGPEGVRNGMEPLEFKLEIDNPELLRRSTFRWSVSDGEIVEMQDSDRMRVRVKPPFKSWNITATVEVSGLADGCNKSASETAAIATILDFLNTEYGKVSWNLERAFLDDFFYALTSDPKMKGLVLFVLASNEKPDVGRTLMRKILRHAEFRKFDRKRLAFAFRPNEYQLDKVSISVMIVNSWIRTFENNDT
jgi:hypothetical protein